MSRPFYTYTKSKMFDCDPDAANRILKSCSGPVRLEISDPVGSYQWLISFRGRQKRVPTRILLLSPLVFTDTLIPM